MKCGLFPLYLFLVFFSPLFSAAQQDQEDSLLHQQALDHTLAFYNSQTGDQSRLYNGRHYNAYPFRFKEGTPFLDSLSFRTGSVRYDGIWYPNIPLLFDVVGQKLITKDQEFDLQLINERISAFTLPGHYFVRMLTDTLNKATIKTGFYEILYPGKSTVLKKAYKSIQEEATTTEGILRTILETTDYFIRSGSVYLRVNSKGELLDALSDHKKEVQRFIKKTRLKYRKQKEDILVQVAAYYDQLKK